MGLASDMRERITLQRYVEGANGIGHAFVDLAIVWAAVEPQGQSTFRFRIRFRDDLRSRADTEPAMRVIYQGEALDLADVIESVRRTELQLIASRRIVEDIDHLATGTRRIKVWP